MKAIVRTCWEICLLRQGPQVFPRSWPLFALVTAIYMLVDAAAFFAQGVRGLSILPQTLLDTALQLAFFLVVLAVWRKLERYVQTATALLGSGTIITLIAIPLSFAATLLHAAPAVDAAAVLVYGILAWSILVMGHVTRHALDTGLFAGIIIAGAYTLLNLVVFVKLFPIKG